MSYNIDCFIKPALFADGNMFLWSNEYIANNVLKKHLDFTEDCGTRKLSTVKRSAEWLSKNLSNKGKVLDVGCGPGFYSSLIASKGNTVLGIDISKYNVKFAKRNNFLQEFTEYRVQDFRTKYFSEDEHYDMIMLMYGLYSFYPLSDRMNFLKKALASLNDGGFVVAEVFTKEHYKGRKESTDWSFISQNGFWCNKPHIELNAFYRYEKDNTVLVQAGILAIENVGVWNSWIHMFDLDEMIDEFREAGFTKFEYFGDCCGSRYSKQSDCIVLFAYK